MTNKQLLKYTIICFIIFIVCMAISPNDNDSPLIIAILGLFCFLAFLGLIIFIIVRSIKRAIFPKKNIPTQNSHLADINISDLNNLNTSSKLAKSSQKQILKAKAKKTLKADAQIEKKHNPVRSISYTPPTDEEEKRKNRDRYLKQNFDSKLKMLWRGSKNIEFSYSDANDDISYRNVELNKVAINEYGDIYFSGICDSCDENRTFKAERIISDIEYNSHDYSLKQFFTKVLNIGDKSQTPKEKIKKETFDIHFTGFSKADEERLIKLAQSKDLTVRKSITQNLQVLCVGYNASKNKLEQAKEVGISTMNESDFLNFLETGEIL